MLNKSAPYLYVTERMEIHAEDSLYNKSNSDLTGKMDVMKSLLIVVMMVLTLGIAVQQVQAYTIIEFGVADRPTFAKNVTFTIEDYRLDEQYEWRQFNRNYEKGGGAEAFSKLPYGVSTAWDDPVVKAQEYEPEYQVPYDNGFFTIINKTLEPGSPVEMCVSYNNNKNMTRCEYTAVADEGGYSVLHLQTDVDAPKQKMVLTGRAQ